MSPTAPFGDWTNGAQGNATVHIGDFEKNLVLRTSAETGRQLLHEVQAARAAGRPQCILVRCNNPQGQEEPIMLWPRHTNHFYVVPESDGHDHGAGAHRPESEDR